MRTWKELEAAFKELIPKMPHTFLDAHWGDSGNHWNVGGMLSPDARARFNTLSIYAGEKALALPFDEEYLDVLRQDQPQIRWFRLLKDLSGSFNQHVPVFQTDDSGNSLGHIYGGRINNLPEVASTVCLKCELLESSYPTTGIVEELSEIGLNAAAEHWRKAQEHRQANPPDMIAAASEAIRALEGVAKEVASLPTGTLGDCIKELRTREMLSPGMARCLEGLWTFANSTHGIRHGASERIVAQQPELDFLLETCGSAIQLLVRISASS